MARTVKTKVNYDVIYGYTVRVDGLVRKDSRRITNEMVAAARLNITANSRKRWTGYRRTGKLARSVADKHQWANQHGCGRTVSASARSPQGYNYATVVHRGSPTAVIARSDGGWMTVGASQDEHTVTRRTVRGQRGNPYLADAMKSVLRLNGYAF
jgi:hypothetical protein